ncbi:MAG: hypothetical protein BAJATHORv1_30321 [Candidatus Thorarchaeota archaeon]|nr:MAG: hypothetical protein BAJATHORv1_30321 [Candidatus Thorarchaeota archaeon]
MKAWLKAMSDYYNPPLPDPTIEYQEDVNSYFYIDATTWTVHLNTAGYPLHLSGEDLFSYALSICHHEMQHYLVCPFDGVLNGMMFAGARKHVNDVTAMFVCNLFADLVVDSGLLKRFPELTRSRIHQSIQDSANRVSEHSALWKLIIACYKEMWGFLLPSSVSIDEETAQAAQKIVKITNRYIHRENRWKKATEKIAKIIKEWNPDETKLAGCAIPGGDDGLDNEDGTVILVPIDVDSIMGSPVEARNGDRARKCNDRDSATDVEEEMERLASEVERRGGGMDDLKGAYFIAGIGTRGRAWTRFWYRAKARTLIRFEIREKSSAASTPLAPQVWRLGDPIEELDVVQSLQAFPVLIPNLSTRRWQTISQSGEAISHSLPDLLVVIDSSGSMTWSMRKRSISGSYHTALIAAFAAVDFALQKGSRVASINFSDGTRMSGWSRERNTVERTLLSYQGGGTVAPIKEIVQACSEAESNVMVVMITDAEIANWKNLVTSAKQMTRVGHKFIMFCIGTDAKQLSSKDFKSIIKAGAILIPVKSAEDLPGMVVREVRGVFTG